MLQTTCQRISKQIEIFDFSLNLREFYFSNLHRRSAFLQNSFNNQLKWGENKEKKESFCVLYQLLNTRAEE